MYDYVKFTGPGGVLELTGYGHYHEEYRKCVDNRWRISSLRLIRILGMIEQLEQMGGVAELAGMAQQAIPARREAGSRDEFVGQ
jgi:hypothetical protein